MISAPILKAKIMLPDIPPGVLYSDRIKDLDIAGVRAVIITAPAGFGKTTAVLLSLQHFRENTHWYRCEKEDAELPVFFSHLIESLFVSTDEKTDSHRSLASIGNITEEYSLLSAIVCQDAWSLYAHSDMPHYLVFDDFQNMSDNTSICEIIRYLISNMPPNMHIIVISRKETGIQAEKLTLDNELIFLDSTSLLFSRDEIKALFFGAEESENSAKYADEIFDYTNGWIAGVTLMMHLPGRRGTIDRRTIDRRTVDRGTVERRTLEWKDFFNDRLGIFRYLVGEVFVGADREMVLKAAMISLLEEFSCEDLTEIFHFDDSEETIAWLERNNFYIYKMNTSPVSYRFHSLFRDALHHVLINEYSPNEITVFHLNAATYFEKTGRNQGAIDHYLWGADEKNAVRVAAQKGLSFMDSGDLEQAAELIRRLPEHLIFSNATLLVIFGSVLSGTETERGFSYLEKAIKMAVKNKDFNVAFKAQGFAISICVQENNFQNIKKVIDLVPMPKAIIINKQARKKLINSLFLKFSTSFQVRPAKALCRIIDRVSMDDQEELWQFSSLLSKAFLYGVIGDFRDAEEIIRELTGHPVAMRNDRWGVFGLQLSCYLSTFMGEKDLLLQLADKMTSLGLKYADGFASSYGANYIALAKYQSRDLAGAILAADKAGKLFIESRNLSMAAFIHIQRISWQAEQDIRGRYADRMEELIVTLEAAGGNESFLSMAKTLTAAQYIHEEGLEKAEYLLEQGWKWAKSKQAIQVQCGIAIHLSALYYKKKDLRREEKYLKFFGETAAQNGYVFFREMRFASLVRACARCVEKYIVPQYIASLVGRYFGFEAAAELLKNPSETSLAPNDFIGRFPANLNPGIKSVRIKLFGPFGLTVDGNEIEPEIFKTSKISGIFKYILANPGQVFSQEKLAAAFWPDSGGKEASNSLRVALSELRKTLAALDMAFDSENALVAEDKSGLYVYRPETLESDVARFVILHEKLQAGSLSKDDERAALYELTHLYDGDYLEESIAEDCTVKRLHFRSIFVEAASKLANIYRSEGRTDLAQAIMLKQLKMANSGLTQIEIKIANLLLDGTSQRDIARKLNMGVAQVRQYENSIRHKLNLLGDTDTQIAAIVAEYKLTKRETDMLKYLRSGASTEEIAAELYISAETVRFHMSKFLGKIGIKSRQDFAAWLDQYEIECTENVEI